MNDPVEFFSGDEVHFTQKAKDTKGVTSNDDVHRDDDVHIVRGVLAIADSISKNSIPHDRVFAVLAEIEAEEKSGLTGLQAAVGHPQLVFLEDKGSDEPISGVWLEKA